MSKAMVPSENEQWIQYLGRQFGTYFETGTAVAIWFVLNISIGSLTKWVFLFGEICVPGEDRPSCRSFKFPLMMTMIHMLFSWVLCYIHINFIRGAPDTYLGFEERLRKVGPLAACFACSVSMGNMSLKFIYPSFNQMVGASCPLITVLMAVVLTRSSFNMWTWLSMPIICGGLILCAYKEANFSSFGMCLAFGAAILRSVKSIIQGKLLDNGQKIDSITLLYYMAPFSASLLFVMSLVAEGTEPVSLLIQGFGFSIWGLPAGSGGPGVFMLLGISGVNAFLLNIANFSVTAYTSAVTLQVLGNVKNCLSIMISVMIFGNQLTAIQGVGVLICLSGVFLYQRRGKEIKCTTLDNLLGALSAPKSTDVELANKLPPSKHRSAS